MNAAPVQRASDSSPNSATARPLRVLVADDDRDGVAMLAWVLTQEGFSVREVYRGDAVLGRVREFSPDAIVLDIGMPGMTGYDVARELKARYGDGCPLLIAVTGWAKDTDKVQGQMVGFEHYLTKPYDPNDLVSLLKTLK